MNAPNADPPPASLWRPSHVAGVFIAFTSIALFLYADTSWPMVLYTLLTDGAVLGAWLFSAWGWGTLAWAWGRSDDVDTRVLRCVSKIGVGLGVLSLATLGLGLIGQMNGAVAWTLVGLGASVGVGLVVRGLKKKERFPRQAGRGLWGWLALVGVPFVAIVIIAALFPPGLLWGDEPHGYDVVAYHLQLPREWFELGRIVPLSHNVFSYFPFNVEMQYLLAMHLRGGPWQGMYLSQLMHATYVGLSVVAVYGAARTFASSRHALLAALACATVPYLSMLAPVAYNEGGLLLYGTLAAGWMIRGVRQLSSVPAPPTARTETTENFFAASVMGGLAVGCKLTAFPVVLVGLGIAGCLTLMSRRIVGRGIVFCGVIVLTGLVVSSPWLVRTAIWANGNPVFPERAELLGQAGFSDQQVERWRQAHSPREDQQSVAGRLGALWTQVASDVRFGYVLLPFGLTCGLLAWRKPEARVLLVWLLLQALFWISLTHLQGRFFVLAIPTCALLVACVDWRRGWFALPVALVCVSAALGWFALHGRLMTYLQLDRQVGLLGRVNLTGLTPFDPATEPNAPLVALVGDAKAFWYQIPMSRLRYRSVFDVDASNDKKIVDAWLGEPVEKLPAGRIVVIDHDELRRFSKTYKHLPAPPDGETGVEVIRR